MDADALGERLNHAAGRLWRETDFAHCRLVSTSTTTVHEIATPDSDRVGYSFAHREASMPRSCLELPRRPHLRRRARGRARA